MSATGDRKKKERTVLGEARERATLLPSTTSERKTEPLPGYRRVTLLTRVILGKPRVVDRPAGGITAAVLLGLVRGPVGYYPLLLLGTGSLGTAQPANL